MKFSSPGTADFALGFAKTIARTGQNKSIIILRRALAPSGAIVGHGAFQSVKNRTETGQTTFFAINFGQIFPAQKRIKPLILLIYFKWWQEPELNRRHKDFQSSALPTELSCQPFDLPTIR
jgi:hypothetical protein